MLNFFAFPSLRSSHSVRQIAEQAEFFSFGTNDLTQMTFGYSRDDVGKFLPIYLSKGILQNDPFEVIPSIQFMHSWFISMPLLYFWANIFSILEKLRDNHMVSWRRHIMLNLLWQSIDWLLTVPLMLTFNGRFLSLEWCSTDMMQLSIVIHKWDYMSRRSLISLF